MNNTAVLAYSNEKHINVIPKEAFVNLLSETFNTISENISCSLGPLGSSATILDGVSTEATKDGFQILKNYHFTNRFKKMIYSLIETPCTRLNNTVGDGTTTSIVLTNYLFQEYKNKKPALETLYRLPKTFVQKWDSIIQRIIEELGNYVKPVTNEDIYNIAYVSSNGNKEVSETIAKIYNECSSPVIKEKDSPTNKTYVEAITGYEFPLNLIDDAYVRNEDLSVVEENFVTLLMNYKLETDVCSKLILPLNDVFRSMGKKLLVMAPFYDRYLAETSLKQYLNHQYQRYGSLNLILGQYELGKLAKHQLEDFSIILKSKMLTQENIKQILAEVEKLGADKFVQQVIEEPEYQFYGLFGVVKKATLSCVNGSTFEPENILEYEPYQAVLRSAKKELKDTTDTTTAERQAYAIKIYDLQARVNRLEMKNYTYYIGADSLLQKKIVWDQVEDVIKCVRSAVKHGSLPGCQLSIIKACKKIMLEIAPENAKAEDISDDDALSLLITEMILNSVLKTYTAVLTGPEHNGILKLIPFWWRYGLEADQADALRELPEEQRKKKIEEYSTKLKVKEIQKAEAIIKESIEKNQVFDLETLEFNSKIITSAETDKLVLLAASELVKILISGTQCIYIDAQLNSSEVKSLDDYS